MSRKMDDFDPDNMSADDIAYFDQRPWLKDEIKMQSDGKIDFDKVYAERRKELAEADLEDDEPETPVTKPLEGNKRNGDPLDADGDGKVDFDSAPGDTDSDDDGVPDSRDLDIDGDEEDEEEPEDYSEFDFAALKAEIDNRNAEYNDEYKISKAGSAEDLRARLIEDDKDSEDEAE